MPKPYRRMQILGLDWKSWASGIALAIFMTAIALVVKAATSEGIGRMCNVWACQRIQAVISETPPKVRLVNGKIKTCPTCSIELDAP